MICFDVYLNGEKLCRAGMKELAVMNSMIDWFRVPYSGEEEMSLHVSGIYDHESGGNAHPKWIERVALKTGDEVTLRIVDSESADVPAAEEVSSREWIEQQEREYYEHLKAKYENG